MRTPAAGHRPPPRRGASFDELWGSLRFLVSKAGHRLGSRQGGAAGALLGGLEAWPSLGESSGGAAGALLGVLGASHRSASPWSKTMEKTNAT